MRLNIIVNNLIFFSILLGFASGETIFFTKLDSADWTLIENQDRITNDIWITRKHNQSIFY